MSQSLTQEQLRRIEENKRRALEKRAKKCAGGNSNAPLSSLNLNRTVMSANKNLPVSSANQKTTYTASNQNVPSTKQNVTLNTCTSDNQRNNSIHHQSSTFSSIKVSSNNEAEHNTSCSKNNVKGRNDAKTEVHQPMGSNLTALERMEQNRLKALALRADRLNKSPLKTGQASNLGNQVSANIKSVPTKVPDVSLHVNSGSSSSASHFQNNTRPVDTIHKHSSTHIDNKSSRNITGTSVGASTSAKFDRGAEAGFGSREPAGTGQGWNAFGGIMQGNVKGNCVLVSRDRFEVKVGYCAPLIELFKNMETKLYDAVSKRWTFKLSEYHKFMSAVRGLKPNVEIESLPRAILQGFSAQLKGDNSVRDIPMANLSKVDPNLVNSLMSFQRTGVNFGVYKNGRVLIADDMGLGKTIQAICLACYYRSDWPVLVVVPSSVRFDWAQQFRRWVPSIDPDLINVVVTGKDSCTKGLVNILSYDLMSRRGDELKQRAFKVVIMDESHLLKNYKTARCRAAIPVLQSSKRVILLSGTPALSRPSELYTQISAVCPFMLKFHEFGIRYCDGKQTVVLVEGYLKLRHQLQHVQHPQMQWGWDFSGSSNMAELQIFLEETVMIRRLKKEVLSELPDKVRHMVMLDPSSIRISKELKTASKVMSNVKLKNTEQRGALLDFFHKSGSAKLKAIKNYVEDLMEQEKKFLIFAHHGDVLDGIEEVVTAKIGRNYIRIDGKTMSEQRSIQCGKFQSKDTIRVAILSITAANAGLNLSAANLVVFAELFWNPGILVQAEDRAHRIGQQDSVSVQYLVATGTSDDSIWPMIQRKLDVLGKAGLTKDNFSAAETTRLKDQRQLEIEQFLEESFSEEFEQLTTPDEEDFLPQQSSAVAKQQSILKYTSPMKDLPPQTAVTPSKEKATQKPSGLFKYFSPSKTNTAKSCDIKETRTSVQTSAFPKQTRADQDKTITKNEKSTSSVTAKSVKYDLNDSLEALEDFLDDFPTQTRQYQKKSTIKNETSTSSVMSKTVKYDLNDSPEALEDFLDDGDWSEGEMDIPPVKKRKVEPFKPPFAKGTK